MRTTSLLFLLRDNEILLAMKKVRYGAGMWNAPGGKADEGETAEQTAIRECEEEVGVTPLDPKLVARFKFYDKADPAFAGFHIHVFTATKWKGEPIETEEMRPKWFKISEIPYDKMWADDKLWIPKILEGKKLEGTLVAKGYESVERDIKEVEKLS